MRAGGRECGRGHEQMSSWHLVLDLPTRAAPDLELHVLADPADAQVLLLSQAPQDPSVLAPERLTRALERADLLELVTVDQSQWQALDGVVAIPWKRPES